MDFWRILLIPFAFLYGLVIRFRHWLFDIGILKSTSFKTPVIGVGNLSFGGTGKTPMIEYLINLLVSDNKLAVISRGYGRKTKGYIVANKNSSYKDIGDEPMQYFHNFKNKLTVAVSKNRKLGITNLLSGSNKPDIILMDDSFQHRAVKPGLSILLTDFHKLYTEDYLVPAGTLRDTVSRAASADIIIVTKTYKVLSPITRRRINAIIKPTEKQSLYFSYLEYGKLISFPSLIPGSFPKNLHTIVLFCGIANSYLLQEYLRDNCVELLVIDFPDHYSYKRKDLKLVAKTYNDEFTRNKLIVTTEKDAMRLLKSEIMDELNNLPLYYLPIKVKLHKHDENNFINKIHDYVGKDKSSSSIH